MRWVTPLLVLASTVISVSAYPQLVPGGPSGDYRVNDGPGTAPAAGSPGGPSLPLESTMFRDIIGSKPPDEVLKSIDKDLGRSTLERSTTTIHPLDQGKEFGASSDKLK